MLRIHAYCYAKLSAGVPIRGPAAQPPWLVWSMYAEYGQLNELDMQHARSHAWRPGILTCMSRRRHGKPLAGVVEKHRPADRRCMRPWVECRRLWTLHRLNLPAVSSACAAYTGNQPSTAKTEDRSLNSPSAQPSVLRLRRRGQAQSSQRRRTHGRCTCVQAEA